MNDTTRQRVIDRIESLAEAALTEVQVPPFAADHHRTAADSPPIRSPRRRILVAAAVTISVAAAGAVLAIYVNSGTRSIRAAGSDPAAGVDAIVPAHWPAGVDSGITTHVDISTLRPREMDDRVGSAVLELDGHAAAAVETVESSLRSISATPPDGRPLDSTPGVLDGRSTLWRNQPDGTLIGYVAVAESRTMIIASRTVDRTELERLASEIAKSGGDPSTAKLPQGWASTTSASNLSNILVFGQPDREWSTISGRSRDLRKHLSVSTTRSSNADAELAQMRDFVGSTGHRVDVTSKGDGVLVAITPASGEEMHAVVWIPSPGLLSIAVGGGVDADEVLATARSAKRATRAQWDALLPVVDRSPMQTVDGFDIPVTATPVGSGESFGLRWMATVDRPVIPEESKEELAAVNLGLVLIDAQGRQGSFSWGDPAQVTSANGQIGKYFVIGARLPSGTTDFKIERNGKPLPYEHVALPDWERELYFTIIPAKDVDPVHVGVLTATLPDGRPYVAVR